MASPDRQQDNSLIEELFSDPQHFNFFKAVRLLERFNPGKEQLGQALVPAKEPVRFISKPKLSFQASDIADLSRPGLHSPAKMDTPFLSLLGVNSILPYWLTESAINRAKKKDRAQIDFYNIFHHRSVSLFYLAWKKYRLAENYKPGSDQAISGHLLSLIGLGTPGLVGKIGVPEESLIYCSGHLSRQVPSAMAIKDTVQYFSGTPVQIKQFIERQLPLPAEDKCRMGLANCRLGVDTVCGGQVWESQSKFRIILSPASQKEYRRFLPSGDLLAPIIASIKYLVGLEFEFDVRVEIPEKEINECRLGDKEQGSQLGWTSWLKSPNKAMTTKQNVTFRHSEIVN